MFPEHGSWLDVEMAKKIPKREEVTRGHWGEVPWVFYADKHQPPAKSSTAAFTIVTYRKKLVLTEHRAEHRSIEFPGGHIDAGETPVAAAIREAREEGGIEIKTLPTYFGYKEVRAHRPVPMRDRPGQFYPNPSYVPYFFVEASELNDRVLADDVVARHVVSVHEALMLLSADHHHDAILQYLFENNFIEVE